MTRWNVSGCICSEYTYVMSRMHEERLGNILEN